jgi:hypothetical protein
MTKADLINAVAKATKLSKRGAGKLCDSHALRAYDAIHLASAGTLREKIAEPLSFASWDSKLEIAARREDLDLVRIREK